MTSKAMKNQLDAHADAIDNVLQAHRIHGRCSGGTVTHAHIRYDLEIPPGTPNARITALSEEFALALRCGSVVVDRSRYGWFVQVPCAAKPILLDELLQQYSARIPPLTAMLGIDSDGSPLLLRILAGDVGHVCVIGKGAKRLLQTIVESLIRTNSPDDLRTIGYPSDSHRWSYERGQMWQSLLAEIERRERGSFNHPTLALVIAELADANDWIIGNFLQRGAAVGVHILAASEQPTEQRFPVLIEGVGDGRFVLKVHGESIQFQGALVKRGDA